METKKDAPNTTVTEIAVLFMIVFLVAGIGIPQYYKNKTAQAATADPNTVTSVTDPNAVVAVADSNAAIVADPNETTIAEPNEPATTPEEVLVLEFIGVDDGRFELIGNHPTEFADRVNMLKGFAKIKGIDTKSFKACYRETEGNTTIIRYTNNMEREFKKALQTVDQPFTPELAAEIITAN